MRAFLCRVNWHAGIFCYTRYFRVSCMVRLQKRQLLIWLARESVASKVYLSLANPLGRYGFTPKVFAGCSFHSLVVSNAFVFADSKSNRLNGVYVKDPFIWIGIPAELKREALKLVRRSPARTCIGVSRLMFDKPQS